MTTVEKAKWYSLAWALALAGMAITAFLIITGLVQGVLAPIILYLSTIVILQPYRFDSILVRRLTVWASVLFWLWIVIDLGTLLLPFVIGFFLAYVLDPVVIYAQRFQVPRWVSALALNTAMVGCITLVALYLAPIVGTQLQELVRSISSFVVSAQNFLESRQFYRWVASLGIPAEQVRPLVQDFLIPKLESASQYIFTLVLSVFTGATGVIAQIVNIILVPLLSFYILTDMPHLKQLLRSILSRRAPNLLIDLIAISGIARAYITGQLITATFVGVFATVGFVVVGIPYGIVLGVLCGLLNPIPYVGLLASLLIVVVTIILAQPPNPLSNIIVAAFIINILHFLAAYIIDPRITGRRVGLHPVLLIAALFVFGHFFGFLGLLVAVPITAVLMMYFQRWIASFKEEAVEQPQLSNAP